MQTNSKQIRFLSTLISISRNPMYHIKKKNFPAGLASYHRSDLSKWKSYFLSEKLNHGARFNKKTKNAKLRTSTIDIVMIILA